MKKEFKEYIEDFIDIYGYKFCENCKRSDKHLELHHIVYRSEAPKHEYLHKKENLLLLCHQCHKLFHGNKRKIRKDICIKRNLEKIFNKNLYDRD